mmetsp:Transcript_61164/g.157744  ORF Transcript_61164/g.157744 Transcript_61164/m.157744 type:complete len:426 (-) Transcript_61164:88-1365(-)
MRDDELLRGPGVEERIMLRNRNEAAQQLQERQERVRVGLPPWGPARPEDRVAESLRRPARQISPGALSSRLRAPVRLAELCRQARDADKIRAVQRPMVIHTLRAQALADLQQAAHDDGEHRRRERRLSLRLLAREQRGQRRREPAARQRVRRVARPLPQERRARRSQGANVGPLCGHRDLQAQPTNGQIRRGGEVHGGRQPLRAVGQRLDVLHLEPRRRQLGAGLHQVAQLVHPELRRRCLLPQLTQHRPEHRGQSIRKVHICLRERRADQHCLKPARPPRVLPQSVGHGIVDDRVLGQLRLELGEGVGNPNGVGVGCANRNRIVARVHGALASLPGDRRGRLMQSPDNLGREGAGNIANRRAPVAEVAREGGKVLHTIPREHLLELAQLYVYARRRGLRPLEHGFIDAGRLPRRFGREACGLRT